MVKTVNEIEQLERILDKESITFKELKEGILKYKAKSEYQQAAIIIIRGVLEKRLHENSGLHKHIVSNNEVLVAVGCHTCKHNPHAPFVPEICDECNPGTFNKWQQTDC